MDTYKILLNGEVVSISPDASLRIIWGKAFDEIYCHHALLELPVVNYTLLFPTIAKVSISVRNNTIEKGQVSSFSDSILTRFLPFTQNQSKITIPLNSIEILEALCENGWTKLKGGERGAPKSFPLSMDIEIDSFSRYNFLFDHSNGKYPYTLSEPYFSNLKNGDKVESIIVIDR